ncbi:MAG TPA: TonB-dependent receptor [Sphingobacteriaceae bacterium]|nr:TonB-dependent receptor [Sphingobacteriaceae bacterium]
MSINFTSKFKITLILLCIGFPVLAQKTIRGTITSAKNQETLIGVKVAIKGTNLGTITNVNGEYNINASNDAVLQFSYLGFVRSEVKLSGQTVLDIVLTEDAMNLEEVVVIGYGSVKKRDLTGSVASVSSEQLKDAASVSFGDALRGKLSGVQVTSSGGEPGAGLDIRIRGINSISASSDPLYVVDGVPIESNQSEIKTGGSPLDQPSINPLSYIDPNNIASIEVLKDASAAAIYGSRGANGVILITTKMGEIGKTQFTFSSSGGVSVFNKRIDMLSLPEYAQYIHVRYPENPLYTDQVTLAPIPYDDSQSINWQDQLFNEAYVQNYNTTFSNNTDRNKLFMSVGYGNTEGVIRGSSFKRLSFLINTDTKISEKLSISLRSNNGYSNRIGQLYGTGQGSSSGITMRILASRPLGPSVVDSDDSDFFSPLRFATLSDKLNRSLTSLTNLTLSYKLTNDLTFKVLGGGYITNSKNTTFLSKQVSNVSNDNGLAALGSALTFNWLNENTLNYEKTFGDHRITGLGGFTMQQNTIESYFLQATNFALEINGANAIQDALSIPEYGSDKTSWALMSYLGRLNYSYKGKYQITGSLRADGSSKFYDDNKFSYFPAVALAWHAGEENLIKKLNLFNQLKFRLSYGLIGNQSIRPYSALSKAVSVRYFSGNTESKGASTVSVANRGLTWETSETFNAGADLSFFKNRINLTADAYVKNTKDLLLDAPVAGSSGFNNIFQNIGMIRNKGLELILGTVNIDAKDFKWTTNINFNVNRNEVVELGTQSMILTGRLVNSQVAPNIIKLGSSLGSLYGYVQEGIYQMDDFLPNTTTLKSGIPSFGAPRPGYLKFKDLSGAAGVPDGIVDAYDRTIIGNANPKHFGGIGNAFSYKRVSLSAFISWQYGNDILNWSDYFLSGASYNNLKSDFYNNMYTATRPSNTVPNYADITGRNVPSSYYIQDGSFVRLQNLTLKYSFPRALLKKVKVSFLDLSLSADNLAVFTDYNGYDPELTSTDPQNIGTDFFSYPRPKTYTVGLNIRF